MGFAVCVSVRLPVHSLCIHILNHAVSLRRYVLINENPHLIHLLSSYVPCDDFNH